MPARFAFVACAFGLFLAAGCGPAKLNVSKTLALDAGGLKSIDLDAQPKPQKVTVEFSAPADVDVLVFKEADAKELEKVEQNKDKALAAKKGRGETFTVDVPENTALRIVFSADKKTEVTVKLTNK